MKAVAYKKSYPIHEEASLFDIELPKPEPGPRDILVEVKANAINPVDAKFRQRSEPPEGEVQVLGWDVSGVVAAVGPQVSQFKVGDEVWYAGAINRPGANSEFHLVDERIAALKPQSLSFAEAAALPLTAITAYEMLFDRFKISPNDQQGSVLIIGGAGGVGSMMIQLLKKLTNLKVIASASRKETKEWVKTLGADVVIDHSNPLSEEFGKNQLEEVDYVASLTQSDHHIEEVSKIIKPQGAYGLIDDPKDLVISHLKRKSISMHWEFMFTRSMFQCEDIVAQHHLLSKVAQMVDAGEIKTTLALHLGKINAENLKRGHALIESGKSKGKMVLEGF
jgi:zinc-binding alcohol dehydrogenase family protein